MQLVFKSNPSLITPQLRPFVYPSCPQHCPDLLVPLTLVWFSGKKSRLVSENDPLLAVINHRPEILQQMLQTVSEGATFSVLFFHTTHGLALRIRPYYPFLLFYDRLSLYSSHKCIILFKIQSY